VAKGCSPGVDSEREVRRGKPAADGIMCQIGQVGDPVHQSEYVQRGCVDPHAHAGLTSLQSPKCRQRNLDAISHYRSLDAPAAASIPNVGSELAEDAITGNGIGGVVLGILRISIMNQAFD
jgi:hypothetical protein